MKAAENRKVNLATSNREQAMSGGFDRRDLRNQILLIDKPEGITSHDTVSLVQRITGASRTGHAGTLDRFASGLLVVCNGRTTKLARFLLEDDKSYTGTVRLGVSTDTDDREGTVIAERPTGGITREGILAAAAKLTGELHQQPPVYSALKVQGRRASDRARLGENVELRPRRIRVHDFEIIDTDLESACFTFRVHCTKGTYVRSLARDLGEMLGTGAHLESLRRTAAGLFSVENAVTVDELDAHVRGEGPDRPFRISPAEALANYGRIVAGGEAREKVLNGSPFRRDGAVTIDDRGGKTFIIMDENENLIAIADVDIQKWHIKYLNVFNSLNGT
ncbi:MAG TPA: tRNA pseudouridine(55) synthase TruB [Spirochaetota bacterium]|nr:tRNA pseudouridine(55) synthase TruB [Spirochaetota bacterium]HPV40154.1 tRNA pseudouridine(55) synthase TruB [Spirochaetota bacterium]